MQFRALPIFLLSYLHHLPILFPMFLIIGLGNPEKKYLNTRHNVGFLAIEKIAELCNASWKNKPDLFAEVAEIFHEEEKIILAKPQTYMNLSGKAVAALMHRYHIEPQHTIVLSDDVLFPVGTIRTRTEGSAGGHNGLKSIITSIGTQQFIRVRIGAGIQPTSTPLERWVLSRFSKHEEALLSEVCTHAANITLGIIHGKVHPQTTYALSNSTTP